MLKRFCVKSFGLTGLLLLVLICGCAYPKEMRQENKINPAEFITVVQQAVDQFHQKTGVLPIKNSDMTTPIYEKYVIDFGKLQKDGLLSSAPANSFESGGIFMYVLVDAETKPTVKLLDLSAHQSAADVQSKVEDYRDKHDGKLPTGIDISADFCFVDFDKLGMKVPQTRSAYNRDSILNYIINKNTGVVAVDYAPDIMKIVQAKSLAAALNPDEDLRELLVQESYFVPAKSFAYHWSSDQPMPAEE